jgi:hypothetical protein
MEENYSNQPIGDFPNKPPTEYYEMPAIPPKWEYYQQHAEMDEGSTEQLNVMGKLGWELISTAPSGFNRLFYIFKRRLPTSLLNG